MNFFYQLEPHSEINALAKKVRLNDFADIQIGGKKFSKNFKQTVHTPLIAFSHTRTHTCTHSDTLARTHTHSHFYLLATNKNFLGVF